MSNPAGWYPQPDGRQRYWDGELWTGRFTDGVPPVQTPADIPREPRFGEADQLGWGGLALVVLMGAMGAGFSGAVRNLGLFTLVVGVIALVRGRVTWARLGSRAAGGAALGTALALITIGAVAAPPAPSGTDSPHLSTSAAQITANPAAQAKAEGEAKALRLAEAAATAEAATVTRAAAAEAAASAAAAKTAAAIAHPKTGTALAAVAALTVKGRAPKTGYSRDQFGQAWFDADRNGCDTRNDILRRDLQRRQMKNACKVMAGTLTPDPYTSASIRFIYGGASEVDIDHVVALSDAWQKGAARWPAGKRLALANDPLNLLAVDSGANRSKGDADAATWLPPNRAFRCSYVARQVAVKGKYSVWVTAAEKAAMTRVLAACPAMLVPGPGSAPTVAVLGASQAQPASSPAQAAPAPRQAAPAPVQPAPAPAPVQPPAAANVYYANCAAVRAAGADPIHRGDPGYAGRLDRDADGIGCE